MTKRTALVISTSNAGRLLRVRRNIEALATAGYSVDIASPHQYSDLPLSRQVVIDSTRELVAKNWRLRGRRRILGGLSGLFPVRHVGERLIHSQYQLGQAARLIGIESYDVILVEEVELLPFALSIAARSSAKIVVDLRDFNWTNRGDSAKNWLTNRRQRFLYRSFLGEADAILVVSEGQRLAVRELLGIEATVVLSVPWYQELLPSSPRDGKIRLVHHGNAERVRSLELLIEAMQFTAPHLELHLYLVATDLAYLESLKVLAQDSPSVYFHEPIAPSRIILTLNEFDIGLVFFPPSTLNLETALPNKLFEFIQARLGVVCGPVMDVAQVVSEYELGPVAQEFTGYALAEALNQLSASDVSRLKRNAHTAASTLCFERQIQVFHRTLEGVVAGSRT